MNKNIWLLLITVLLISASACGPPPEFATVTRVINGDTIVIDTGQKVRYIGIDTPEVYPVAEAFGMEAWKANRQLVEGKVVRLERDVSETDKNGRLLRYVYVGDILINAQMVILGLAEAKAYPPDTINQKHLEGLEAIARSTGRGMWAE